MKNNSRKKVAAALLLSLTTVVALAEEQSAQQPSRVSSSRQLWSWLPVQSHPVPTVAQKDWVRTPVDAFVLEKLEANNLKPSPDADRATFIRRATLDVWGLIPTPEEVAVFVNDTSPDAYEKLIDRLLASPRYGERQARRWLDLARYSDTTGFQNDDVRANMWRYRDYVINSFNQNKPYSDFIREQVAGDEIAPGNQDIIVATGFLAGYPDNYNSRDLIQRKFQITTDMTDTLGQAVLGTTVGCARCHNHKSDKFSQKDYYSLQAFFANTSEENKILVSAKGEIEHNFEKQQAKWDEATKDIRASMKAIIDPIREAASKYHKERYLTDSRASIFKAEDQWTPLDRWVNHRLANVTTDTDYGNYLREVGGDQANPEHTEDLKHRWEEYKKLTEELKKFDKLKPTKGSITLTTMTELGHPDTPPTHVLFGGNHERPEEEVQPAFPVAMTDEAPVIVPTPSSSGRRTALADWLVSEKNPLTARVYANRVWSQYFTNGLVKTVSDFGRAGEKPTHPELLDYLAETFVDSGWDIKKLHRAILLSSAYRQSSDAREDAAKADPYNKLLAVFSRQRLDAEQIRDSLLVASGKLVDKVGGPSVYPPVPQALNAGASWPTDSDAESQNRRSLYIFTRRSLPYPLLDSFDMASPQQIHSKRDVTTTPLQALTLFNNDIVFAWSQALAGRVIREVGRDESAQIDRLYQILFGHNPQDVERNALLAFTVSHARSIRAKATDGKLAIAIPIGFKGEADIADPIKDAVFVDLVHAVVNSNNFIYRF
ncbi:DUF1549 and DUF1553 domain-containing protein [Beijerinckia mobilis]|uniref:DUF1549 and DUF1553 domain-containing protein n=1 Tax=Beijerinckia mobilis TaxID=231434 RepID=UPI00054D6E9F|nr:DUF1549 and DUF1553 domain-containing protein [Beijerinckia mobilis]